jgi:hypothetical protein
MTRDEHRSFYEKTGIERMSSDYKTDEHEKNVCFELAISTRWTFCLSFFLFIGTRIFSSLPLPLFTLETTD